MLSFKIEDNLSLRGKKVQEFIYTYLNEQIFTEYSQRKQKSRKIENSKLETTGKSSPEYLVKLGFQYTYHIFLFTFAKQKYKHRCRKQSYNYQRVRESGWNWEIGTDIYS